MSTPGVPWEFYVITSSADQEGGGGAVGPDPLPENHKLYGFL